MTMWTTREGKSDIKVSTTYGPITNTVVEPASHLRFFAAELTRLVEEIEGESNGDA
jgi:hypothetical protein